MLHGKKGFSRILWTCKNVLNQSLTWVFADVNSSNAEAVSAALETHRPRWFVSRPASTTMSDVVVPEFSVHDEKGAADLAYAQELEEWLGLVVMRSERVTMGDRPNPFSCRYEVPSMDGMTGDEEVRQVVNLRVVRWHGFMPSRFALDMMVWLRRAAKGQHWFALQTKGLTRDQDGLTLSHMGARGLEEAEYMCWHVPS